MTDIEWKFVLLAVVWVNSFLWYRAGQFSERTKHLKSQFKETP